MVTEGDIQGHWQRIWLRAPGFEDGTTRVHWMQSGAIYADVRIPMDRPNMSGARCLADLDPDALSILAEAEGFAGLAVVQNSTCTWARHINWHGETEEIDAGKLSFDESGDLIEDGIYADYAELWTRTDADPDAGLHMVSGDYTAYLVTVGTRFVFAIGKPQAMASKAVLCDLERGRHDAEALAELFDRVHMIGTWRGDTGYADLATNPFMECRPCLTRTAEGLVYTHVEFDGKTTELPLEVAPLYAEPAQLRSA